jgi:hypothetical protein
MNDLTADTTDDCTGASLPLEENLHGFTLCLPPSD